MPKFYVYTLSYPSQMGGAVFYIGKGQEGRMHSHCSDDALAPGACTSKALRAVLTAIKERGLAPVALVVLESDNEQAAYDEEFRLITLYDQQVVNVRRNLRVLASYHYSEPERKRIVKEETAKRRADILASIS